MDGYKKSRKKGYAAVLKTAPAYTWGKAHERVKGRLRSHPRPMINRVACRPPHMAALLLADDPGPGPGEYDPVGDKYNKGLGFGSSTRYKIGGDEVPG